MDYLQLRNEAKDGDEKALELLTQAAEKGNADAQWNLGMCYGDLAYGGKSYEKDELYKKAAHWFGKAVEQGHSAAMNNFASYFKDGCGGMPKDLTKAAELYCEAAKRGAQFADYFLEELANEGHTPAQKCMGDLKVKEKEYKEAAGWYTKAANQGHDVAKEILNTKFKKGVFGW